MKQLSKKEIQKINVFNTKLTELECKIYRLCLEENKRALVKVKDTDILDYDINVHYAFYGASFKLNEDDDEHLIAHWHDNVKHLILSDEKWGLNDKNCHNVTSAFQKNTSLNAQKHCWLLHSLYDHHPLDWDDIFMIEDIYFDVEVQYEYQAKFTSFFE